MQTPVPNLYAKYGDPHRVVEFRIFSFNKCGAGCKNCFYQKTNNNYNDFKSVLNLANEMKLNQYALETCYLLPTDVFENDFNYKLFDDSDFQQVISLFNYIGLATTLRNGYDEAFMQKVLSMNEGRIKVELHVNLREDLLNDETYIQDLECNLISLKTKFGEKVLINLAVNLGSKLSEADHLLLKRLVCNYSDDKILEMNFTFMFNSSISKETKVKYLKDSYPTMQYFSNEFSKVESEFNRRTLLRKPSFVFKDGQIYLLPIIPFDEYVFLEEEACRLHSPTFESFLIAYSKLQETNLPILKECENCHYLEYCSGKGFFSLAQSLNLPCIKEVSF
jgi:hypothetical protein